MMLDEATHLRLINARILYPIPVVFAWVSFRSRCKTTIGLILDTGTFLSDRSIPVKQVFKDPGFGLYPYRRFPDSSNGVGSIFSILSMAPGSRYFPRGPRSFFLSEFYHLMDGASRNLLRRRIQFSSGHYSIYLLQNRND